MTPEREKEIRTWVSMRYGKSCNATFNACEELLKEIDELRGDRKSLIAQRDRVIQEYLKKKGEVQELTSEVSSLRESIRIYGGHCGGCTRQIVGGPPSHCTCGFREVYEKATIKNNERTESNSNAVEKPGGV